MRARFSLIACGIIVFFILGPVIILAARGFRYDFGENRLIKTGTLVVKTDPKNAVVFLNGKKINDTPFVKRFLLPGEYELEIKKDGFRAWKKRIAIHEQEVTAFLGPNGEQLTLFNNLPDTKTISSSTADFFVSKDTIFYLQSRQIFESDFEGNQTNLATTTPQDILDPKKFLETYEASSTTTLPDNLPNFPASPVDYVSSGNDKNILAYGNAHEIWLYDRDGQKNYLVTRSSQNLSKAVYNSATGYVFVAEENVIKAIEYDSLGQPNVYTFAETKTASPKFAVSPDGVYLIYLDGQELTSLKIL